ncbi:cysteine--tRNA ligase [Rhizocola hellebori]|uniref:Cysteine--tRNA ligase n=1 Tax=Rhizocola hellebori TaxID=1392758 RepID=A0A8J3VN02_9ACTN|nr:cysteine--tRNA ligase [Rhizocola hellebori]GIH11653.1 cysteine--tRNA ligase [Rhizocola hellebori]
MALRLYDTLTRQVRDFEPRVAGQASVYLCGLTVQSGPHIGHLRSGVNYDVLRRWLVHSGYAVTFVRNITDIDDKILAKSLEQGRPFWSIAYENEVKLSGSYRALNVAPPTYEPRATQCIPEMQVLITELIERGHAYAAKDGSGDVYFSVSSYPDYGALSNQRPDEMLAAPDGPERAKKDPRDFALWKGVKPTEPQDAYWPSPWGRGRPGWHIECSAMTFRFLGPEFDIHGGGTDLVFPHHENEMTQSRAAGHDFAAFWLHNGMVDLGGEKMAKSVGNVIDVAAVQERGIRPVELRYYMLAPHYRARIEFSWGALDEAATAYQRIEGFVQRASEVGEVEPSVVCAEFEEAMNDDLNTSAALAAIHEVVREGNTALAAGEVKTAVGAARSVRAMLGLLGLDPQDPAFTTGGDQGMRETVDALVSLALQQRTSARERKDWAAADAVRDQLKQAGVAVEDTPQGPRWTIGADRNGG